MTIYIDSDYKCYTEPREGLTAVKTNFFDECMIPEYIEGYAIDCRSVTGTHYIQFWASGSREQWLNINKVWFE